MTTGRAPTHFRLPTHVRIVIVPDGDGKFRLRYSERNRRAIGRETMRRLGPLIESLGGRWWARGCWFGMEIRATRKLIASSVCGEFAAWALGKDVVPADALDIESIKRGLRRLEDGE